MNTILEEKKTAVSLSTRDFFIEEKFPFELKNIQTPAIIISEDALRKNLEKIKENQSPYKCLLALKAFSNYHFFDIISEYLDGTSASSLNESKLGLKKFKKEVCYFSPGIKPNEFKKITQYINKINFNSEYQYHTLSKSALEKNIKIGIRINPEISSIKTDLYNPCGMYSRFGIPISEFKKTTPFEKISGIMIHNHNQNNSTMLKKTIEKLEQEIPKTLEKITWINLGGGHLISHPKYDTLLLKKTIENFKKKYNLEVYLEPGEAIVLNTGFLIGSILDIVNNKTNSIVILDISPIAHAPEVLEMPYTPIIWGAKKEGKYRYLISGCTCISGDFFGEYFFDKKLKVGEKLVLHDMAHYTSTRTTHFNGISQPRIYKLKKQEITKIKSFTYNDFIKRL